MRRSDSKACLTVRSEYGEVESFLWLKSVNENVLYLIGGVVARLKSVCPFVVWVICYFFLAAFGLLLLVPFSTSLLNTVALAGHMPDH